MSNNLDIFTAFSMTLGAKITDGPNEAMTEFQFKVLRTSMGLLSGINKGIDDDIYSPRVLHSVTDAIGNEAGEAYLQHQLAQEALLS